MIANIAPNSASFDETMNTLKYADRAKSIKTTVTRNVVTVNFQVSGECLSPVITPPNKASPCTPFGVRGVLIDCPSLPIPQRSLPPLSITARAPNLSTCACACTCTCACVCTCAEYEHMIGNLRGEVSNLKQRLSVVGGGVPDGLDPVS